MAQLTNRGTAIRFICDHHGAALDLRSGVIQDARAERLQRSVAPSSQINRSHALMSSASYWISACHRQSVEYLYLAQQEHFFPFKRMELWANSKFFAPPLLCPWNDHFQRKACRSSFKKTPELWKFLVKGNARAPLL